MSDKLDNDLKNRIREVFDHYEDDTADAGWELLRQKFPEEKKHRVIAWWWYSAAAVLLLCLGTWFFYPQNITQQMVSNHKKNANKTGTHNTETTAANTGELAAANKNTATQSVADQTNTSLSGTNNQQQGHATTSNQKIAEAATSRNETHTDKISSEPINSLRSIASVNTSSHRQGNHKAVSSEAEITIPGRVINNDLFDSLETATATRNLAKVKQKPVTASPNTEVVDDVESTTKVAAVQQPEKTTQASVVVQKTDPVLKMIAADDARRQALAKNATGNKKSETAKSNKAVIMSLYAATYFNYAKGSQSQLGVGGGFTSDFRVSDNFKISTGLSIGQNRLSYSSDNNIPAQISNQALAMVNKSASVMASYSLVTSLRSVAPDVKNYNASLIGLDIPLNIKYQFNPKKNDTYISAGISSGTYINETYRSTYTNGNNLYNAAASSSLTLNAVNSTAQQTQENTSSQHFGSFDFARTLNFSFGMGYPLGKNRLVIEPFLKYPLSGLGSQDIKFGASGINLKLSFSTSKK